LANTGFRGALSLVPLLEPLITDDVPLHSLVYIRPLIALFARVVKLGSGAYGARHARVRPSVMQCVLAVRETVVIKPTMLNIVAQGLSDSLPHSLP